MKLIAGRELLESQTCATRQPSHPPDAERARYRPQVLAVVPRHQGHRLYPNALVSVRAPSIDKSFSSISSRTRLDARTWVVCEQNDANNVRQEA